jgi:hypothetical protein
MTNAEYVAFYEARWVIWNSGETVLLLTGESAGGTAKPPGRDYGI